MLRIPCYSPWHAKLIQFLLARSDLNQNNVKETKEDCLKMESETCLLVELRNTGYGTLQGAWGILRQLDFLSVQFLSIHL
jgi:hypothetical protein